jgi:deoxycytidine triphosphate deaminase
MEARVFLLSEQLIRRYIDRSIIRIGDIEYSNLYPTCYYFQLGRIAEVVSPEGFQTVNVERARSIVIPPQTVARVESKESFTLRDNVLALLGNQTSLLRDKQLQLLHGPTIDPGWNQRLALAIYNMGSSPTAVNYGERIGKAMFFDISDSALEEARLTPDARRREQELQRGD